jgi:hypothetical protein
MMEVMASLSRAQYTPEIVIHINVELSERLSAETAASLEMGRWFRCRGRREWRWCSTGRHGGGPVRFR